MSTQPLDGLGASAQPLDLLVVGDVNPDLIVRAEDARPVFGQAETLVDSATLTIGSSAAIVACGAARLGLRTALIGKVGDDLFGRFMLEELRGRGVDTGGCVVSERSATGISVILTQPHDRAILTYRGALAELRYDDIDKTYLQRARHLHVSSLFLLDGLRGDLPRLFLDAKSLGLSTSLDTNWD
ncbi:MAG TPA: carbohydrate kinase family protein, partial [Trueperaceae bacterium]|nr:carbohydrate kinase family protein [Trueperaceae bacterium]